MPRLFEQIPSSPVRGEVSNRERGCLHASSHSSQLQESRCPDLFRGCRAATVFFMLVLVFLFLYPASACNLESFVPLQFYDHCRDLAAKVQEAAVSRKLGHPDADKLANRLLNAWVDFYLEHGSNPPPMFAHISSESWLAAMRTMGYGIRHLVDQSPDNDDGDSTLLPLYLLVNPAELAESGNMISSWTMSLESNLFTSENPASFTLWLENSAVKPLMAVNEILGDKFPRLSERVSEFLVKIREDWRPVVHADPAEQASMAIELMPRLRRDVFKENSRWRNLFFR